MSRLEKQHIAYMIQGVKNARSLAEAAYKWGTPKTAKMADALMKVMDDAIFDLTAQLPRKKNHP